MRRAIVAGLSVIVVAIGSVPGGAQQRLTGIRTTIIGPVYEAWSFGDGLFQPMSSGADSVRIDRASQWTLPVAVVIPLGARFTLDVSAAFASAQVKLAGPDTVLDTDSYSLSGLTDTKIRLTTKLAGENVLFTLGINGPTGKTELDDEELAALRVMAAPALGFTIPALGTGAGGTAGIVVAREVNTWAWAFGASYEMRGEYSPVSLAAGVPTTDFNPSDAIHVSLGVNGLVGQNEMTLGVAGDFFGEDELRSGATAAPATKLGPIYTVEWTLDFATRRLREASLFVVDRYRSSYEQNGQAIDESSGNYLDAGLRLIFPAGARTGIITALALRHQTGLKVDNTFSTAAAATGALTVGVSRELASGYMLQPFLRAQLGKIETGENSANANAIGLGVTFSRRF